MAHEIDFSKKANGAAYFAENPAWHGYGTVTKEALTSVSVIEMAGLDFEIQQMELVAVRAAQKDEKGNVIEQPVIKAVSSHVANVRSDTKEVLGIVSNDYVPLQNADAFAWMDSLVDQGELLYESAGSLKGGKVIWMLARHEKAKFETFKGDMTVPYWLLTTAHDGTRSVRIMPTATRVVCWNTLSMALRDEQAGVSVRHIVGMRRQLEQAKEALGFVTKRIEEYAEATKTLARKDVTEKVAKAYLVDLLPQADGDGQEITRNTEWRKKIFDNFQGNDPTIDMPGSRGTAWGLVNSVTRFVDWQQPIRGKDEAARRESRFNSSLLGPGSKLKSMALDKALALV